MRRKLDKRERSRAGLTVVELMVSLVLAAMLSAGLFYMMTGQSKTYEIQVSGLNNQENLWGAMEFIQAEVRKAGYGFSICPGGLLVHGNPSTFGALRVYNGCNIYTTNPSSCESSDLDGTAAGNAAPANNAVDSLTISYTDPYSETAGLGGTVRVKKLNASAAVTFVDAPGTFSECDLIVIWDPETGVCHMALVDGPAEPAGLGNGGKYKIQHKPGGSCGGVNMSTYNKPDIPNDWNNKAGLMVTSLGNVNNYKPRHIAIDDTVDPPRLVTWTSANQNPRADLPGDLEVIAHGIEDFQISVACDNGRPSAPGSQDGLFLEGDGVTIPKTDDEWAWNIVGDTKPDCGTASIGQVRITLTARSHGVDLTMNTGKRPAAEDRPEGSTDKYHRRRITATVSPRNIRKKVTN